LNNKFGLPETLEQADPMPWRARATNRTVKLFPSAKTGNENKTKNANKFVP